MVGYWIVDCESPERACELAARFPDRRRPRALPGPPAVGGLRRRTPGSGAA
ncbi:hypothetical protein [Spinactinospora alkalitolerans]|uniref:hypothetical protein n=1 Tax=Spinactinospora alkalitolerans TaxID=687207 RepID=UPI001FE5B229|nr:hypothetical protein [Spinactinospora alkalitolerans]